jgi:hypothetical protein
MPRLSLYKPERGQDYKFIDRNVSEMFQAGGTDIYIHKYVGPKNPTTGSADQPIYDAVKETNIQDLLFLENRDRKYEAEIYRIRGHYNVANIDFNLSQFGLFIDNDTIFLTVHINDIIKTLGRKPLSGDVIELPHLRDDFALNDFDMALPRYYVIEDIGRASEGFSSTWYPHLYRLKCKKVMDNQQYADIFNQAALDANGDPILNSDGTANTTLRDLLSMHNKELAINDAVVLQAEADAPKSGYETRQFYTLAVGDDGTASLQTADETELDVSNTSYNTSDTSNRPVRTGYTGYLVGDGFPQNGYEFGHGIQFPANAAKDDFFLRTDFLPNRLFRFDDTRWVTVESAVRMNMTNNDSRQTQKTSFINNTDYIYNDAVAVDYIKLPPEVVAPQIVPVDYNYVIPTNIDYVVALYVVFKLDSTEIAYAVADYPTIITNNLGKVKITLPVINTEQQVLPYDGIWKLTLCNNREAQRQSLSKVLRPRADF